MSAECTARGMPVSQSTTATKTSVYCPVHGLHEPRRGGRLPPPDQPYVTAEHGAVFWIVRPPKAGEPTP